LQPTIKRCAGLGATFRQDGIFVRIEVKRRSGEGWRGAAMSSRTRALYLFRPFGLFSKCESRERCEMSFPPRCYYCRRIIRRPFGLVFFRAFAGFMSHTVSARNQWILATHAMVEYLKRTDPYLDDE
jgi:hypothetical protein